MTKQISPDRNSTCITQRSRPSVKACRLRHYRSVPGALKARSRCIVASERRSTRFTSSGYQLLSNGFGRRVSAVASTEFDLHFFQVSPHGLFTDAELLCDFPASHPQ
jgi:hypothetical protein